MTCRPILPILALTLLVPNMASAAANKEHLQLMAEIRMLQEQQQQLQGLLGALQDTLKTVTTKLDDQAAVTRKAMADQNVATTNIGDNVRVLREKTDETNVRISTMSQELESLRQAIATQPAPQPGPPPVVDPLTGAPGGVAPTTPTSPQPAPPAGVSPTRMFEASYDDYSIGHFELAIQGFQSFLLAFPKVSLAPAALYNIGMSYYGLEKWAEARDAFQKVITDYPTAQGSTLPDSYYKLGQTYERLKQTEAAKKMYEAAIQKFPGAPSALANQALQRLNRG